MKRKEISDSSELNDINNSNNGGIINNGGNSAITNNAQRQNNSQQAPLATNTLTLQQRAALLAMHNSTHNLYSQNSRIHELEFFMSLPENPNKYNGKVLTPLKKAKLLGRDDIIVYSQELSKNLKQEDTTLDAKDLNKALVEAISDREIDVIEALIEKGADVNFYTKPEHAPIVLAIITNDRNVTKLLINKGANIELIFYNFINTKQFFLQLVLSDRKFYIEKILPKEFSEAYQSKNILELQRIYKTLNQEKRNYIIKKLDDKSFAENFVKSYSVESFKFLFDNGLYNLAMLNRLAEVGADIDNIIKGTAQLLFKQLLSSNTLYTSLLDLLIDKKFINIDGILQYNNETDVDETIKGRIPITYASNKANYELLKYLLKKGADSTKTDANKKHIFVAINKDKDIADLLSQTDKIYWLKYAILGNKCRVLNTFMKWGFDVNGIDGNRDNLLTFTISNFNKIVKSEATYSKYKKIFDCLLNNDIYVNHLNNNGNIALNIAVRNECPREIIFNLLQKQSYTHITNNNGFTALKEAIERLNFDIIRDLIKYGAEFNESLKRDLINKTSEKLVASLLDAVKDPRFDLSNNFANFLVNKNDIESFKILLRVYKQKYMLRINKNLDVIGKDYFNMSLYNSIKDNKLEFAKLSLPYLKKALITQSQKIIEINQFSYNLESFEFCKKLLNLNNNALVELILEHIPKEIFKFYAGNFIDNAIYNNNMELYNAYCKKIQAYNFEISKDLIPIILMRIIRSLEENYLITYNDKSNSKEILKTCLISNIFSLNDIETKNNNFNLYVMNKPRIISFVDYLETFKDLSVKALTERDEAKKAHEEISKSINNEEKKKKYNQIISTKDAQGKIFFEIYNAVTIYHACRKVLEDKGGKEDLVKLINSKQDLEFIAAITKTFFENNFFKYSPKDIESYINKLRISDNHKNENQFKLLQKDKEINEFNAMLIQIKKDLYKQIEVTKGCLYSLENLIIDNICPELSEIITYNTLMKNQQKLEFLDEVPNWPEPRKPLFNNSENILDLVVHKQNSADKYDFKGEILGQGDILRKFLEKLKPNIGDNEEGVLRILLPDVWDDFIKLYNEIKQNLPMDIIIKVNSFISSSTFEDYEIDMENPIEYIAMDTSENYPNPMEIEDTHGVMG
jgi:hypothetical protein